MTVVTLSAELDATLADISRRTGISPEQLVRDALAHVLEDMADLRDALAVEAVEDPAERVSLQAMRRELGMEG
jgi:predicted DNA-binding protein